MIDDFTSKSASASSDGVETSAVVQSMADFDEADYRPYLDGLDLSDEQASELLHILWDMMRMCMEMKVPAESWGQIVSPLFLAAATDSATVD